MAHELTFEEIQDCKKVFENFKITNEPLEDSKMRISDLEQTLQLLQFKIIIKLNKSKCYICYLT